jgi:hypothetical protein
LDDWRQQDGETPASLLDLELGYSVWCAVWSKLKRSTRGTHLGYWEEWLSDDDDAQHSGADGLGGAAPVSAHGRHRAQDKNK